MNPQHFRILHEYEIKDSLGQHQASLLYLRDISNPYLDNNQMDEVGRLLYVLRMLPSKLWFICFTVIMIILWKAY